MIDEFELFRARAYGLRDNDTDQRRDVITDKSGHDVTSGSQRSKYRRRLLVFHCV